MADSYHHGNLRQALIEAGIKIINESGEENLSLRKVAALCNVSHAAPYAHFKDKDELLEAIKLRPGMAVLADKAYGKWELREYIANHGADFCIPPKSNESDPWFVDWWLYEERHLVETFFLKLKEFRRVATRYDKRADRFLAFVHLACIRILLA